MSRRRPRQVWAVVPSPSPLSDAMADQNYRQAVAARGLNQPPPPQEPPVTSPAPRSAPTPSPNPASLPHARLEALADRLAKLEAAFEEVQNWAIQMQDELATLKAGGGGTASAERERVNQKIIDFLTSMPGVKFSAVSIAENLGLNPPATADRMRVLATKGRVQAQKQDNRHPLYFAQVR